MIHNVNTQPCDLSRCRLSVRFTVDDISGFGDSSRELFIKSSCYSSLPITVSAPGPTVTWTFTSEPKSISFSVIYKESADTPLEQAKVRRWVLLLGREGIAGDKFKSSEAYLTPRVSAKQKWWHIKTLRRLTDRELWWNHKSTVRLHRACRTILF